jgi:hypothetical protein
MAGRSAARGRFPPAIGNHYKLYGLPVEKPACAPQYVTRHEMNLPEGIYANRIQRSCPVIRRTNTRAECVWLRLAPFATRTALRQKFARAGGDAGCTILVLCRTAGITPTALLHDHLVPCDRRLPFCAARAAATAFSRFWKSRRERYQLLAWRKHSDSPPGKLLFSLMTSFTQCPETSFTLPRVRSTQGGSEKDGMEDDGCSRAEGSVCGGGQAENAAF